MSQLQVQWTAHADFERMLAEVFQDDPVEGIKELAANSFDADASRVDFTYHPGVLIAKDNGIGMGVYELRHGFYKSGDSLTRRAGKTKRGRIPMGNYGIGTIVMQFLAKGYKLETWRDGQKLIVEETFPEGKRPQKVLKAIPEVCNADMHGTTITIEPTRFSSEEVTIDQLIRRLALGVNVQSRLESGDRFEMYVNGEMVKLKNPNPALAFSLSKYDPMVGQVNGKVSFYNTIPPFNGIVLRVNGRQVGTENFFDDMLPIYMRGRIYADVDVDLMASRISFSRARFQEDTPHFRKLVSILEEYFKSIRPEVEAYLKQSSLDRGRSALESTLSQTSEMLRSLPDEVTSFSKTIQHGKTRRRRAVTRGNRGNSKGADVNLGELILATDIKEGFRMVLVSDKSTGFGMIDANSGAMYLNVSHPYFTLPGKHQAKSLQIQILYALSEILGAHKLGPKASKKYAAALQARNQEIVRLAQEVFAGLPRLEEALMTNRDKYSKRGINPERLYTANELRRDSPIDKYWLGRFEQAGLLRPSLISGEGAERYSGANIILAMERMKGGTPAFYIVKSLLSQEQPFELSYASQTISKLVGEIDQDLSRMTARLPYVFNIGVTNFPLFVVMSGYEEKFRAFYEGGYTAPGREIPAEFLTLDAKVDAESTKNPAVGAKGTESWDFMQMVSKANRHPSISVDQAAHARRYNSMDSYHSGQIVFHEAFGFGMVSDFRDKEFSVKFKGQNVSLAHNRSN